MIKHRRNTNNFSRQLFAAILAGIFCMAYVQNLHKMITDAPLEILEEYEGKGEDDRKENKEAADDLEFLRSEWKQVISLRSKLVRYTSMVAFWNNHIPETLTPPPENC